MARTLVVYFSRSGYTRRLAEEIARRTEAELEAIEGVTERAGPLGYLRCAWEALTKRPAEIRAPAHAAADFDVVILGTPVWAGNISSPMRAYIAAQGKKCRQVAFFCTQGGSGGEKVQEAMARLCGRTPLATLTLNDRNIDQNTYAEALDGFLENVMHSRSNA
jgi:flavodoxin